MTLGVIETEPREAALYLPTPDEIRAVCLEIQAGWSDEERERRCVYKPTAWAVPGGDR